jgi:hypothetical protein
LLDRGEFDLYLLRARDMRNNSWVLTGYPLLQVNLPGGGGQGKGVKRGETGDIRDLETPKTFQFPSVP